MSEIRRGALLSYLTIIVVNFSGLLVTPFIIRALGNSEYGLYLLIGSLAAYLGVLDFGLNNAVTRYVAQCVALKDRKQEPLFLGAALVVNGLAVVVIIGVGAFLYVNIGIWFSDTLDSLAISQARMMLLLMVANVIFTISSSLFTAVCAGHQRFTFSKMINLLRYVLRIGLVLAILNAGGGAVILVAMDTALSLIVLILNAFYSIQALGARFNLRSLNIQLIRGVLSFSAWVFLFAIIGQVQWQSGQIIIGRIDGPESVAVYGIGIMFGTYYGAFSTALTGLFLARATYMTVSNANSEELCAEMQRIGRIALIILLLIVGGFACFGREFLLLWAGPDYGPSWGVAMVIMLAYTVPLVQSFANQLLEAKGLFKFKAKVYLVALPLGVVVGYFLFRSLGLLGMAVGMAAGWLAAVLIMNIYYHKVLHLDIPQFFVGISKGVAPTFLACMVIGGLLRMVPVPGWFGLFIQVSFFIVFYCLLMYSFGMNSFERQEAKSIVERFRWNRV